MQLLLLRGDAARMTAATEFNNVSSRSHAVMQITIESRDRNHRIRTSTLSMIDLAGSEKASTQDLRRKEGAFINKSLLTLGTVISRLTTTTTTTGTNGTSSPPPFSAPATPGGNNHIPYRDSKLTRLLQPSLSGGGYITVLATICGGQKFSSETVSTLQFARRAKKIAAKATLAESFVQGGFEGEAELRRELGDYKAQVDELKGQLEIEKARKGNVEEMNELKVQREQLNNRIERLSVLALAAGDSHNPIVQQVNLFIEETNHRLLKR
jgi:centromeric protein E